MPTGPDAYNNVRLLNEPFHEKMQSLLGGQFAVGIPNRDFFVAVSLESKETVRHVRNRVLEDYETMDHPLTTRLLLVSRDGISEYIEAEDEKPL